MSQHQTYEWEVFKTDKLGTQSWHLEAIHKKSVFDVVASGAMSELSLFLDKNPKSIHARRPEDGATPLHVAMAYGVPATVKTSRVCAWHDIASADRV